MKKKIVLGVIAVVSLFALYLIGCTGSGTSALAGRWVPEAGQSISSNFIERSADFSKDGTGIADGLSLTWTTEKGRLILRVSGSGYAYDYKISGSTLTLTDDSGRSVRYNKQSAPVASASNTTLLLGIWEDDDETDTIEFKRNGTGNWDGGNMTWSINNNKLTMTAFNETVTFYYKINGSNLTLIDEQGDVYNVLKKK